MLRSVFFSNFVKFKEYHYLDFSNGSPSIFIGENGTGKSAVLEGIRRCLKPELSTSVSSIPDPKKLSYFICNFENFDGENEFVLSGFVVLPGELENETTTSSANNSTVEPDYDLYLENLFQERKSADEEHQESVPISDGIQEDGINEMHQNNTTGNAPSQQEQKSVDVETLGFLPVPISGKNQAVEMNEIHQNDKTGNATNQLGYECSNRENALNTSVVASDELQNENTDSSGNNRTAERNNEPNSTDTKPDANKQSVYKFVTKYSDPNEETLLYVGKRNRNGEFDEWRPLQTDQLKDLVKVFESIHKHKNPKKQKEEKRKKKEENFRRYLSRIFNNQNIDDSTYENRGSETEGETLINSLSDQVVFTFPLHSIGPLQWSKSPNICRIMREDNYSAAEKRCEVIRYFFENSDKFDKTKEKKYFKTITQKEDDHDVFVFDENQKVSTPNGKYGILKIPEGIYEAEIISILLSSKRFKTIILEEPDRGMHPQFVNRMMQVINESTKDIEQSKEDKLQKIEESKDDKPQEIEQGKEDIPHDIEQSKEDKPRAIDQNKDDKQQEIEQSKADKRNTKRIILTTHNKALITPWSLPNCFVFRNIANTGDVKFCIFPAQTIIGAPTSGNIRMKKLRQLTSDHVSDIFFARKILFFEGDSELLFFTELKQQILRDELQTIPLFESVHTQLKKTFSELTLVKMGGRGMATFCHDICERLELEHLIVLDRDDVHTENIVDRYWFIRMMQRFGMLRIKGILTKLIRWITQKRLDKTYWPGSRDEESKEGNFFWIDGDIEDMMLQMSLDKPELNLLEQLKKNNVMLKLSTHKKKKATNDKLFLHPKVTLENVNSVVKIITTHCTDTDDLYQLIKELGKDRLFIKKK